jgi:alpha-D-ribose 1-methylphosphonate 5-triphosphate synthase subunit PhnI
MPGFNGRGPMGAGPMTGGGRGFCTGSNVRTQPLYDRQGFDGGYGYGRGRGYGRGFRRAGDYPTVNIPRYNTPNEMNFANELDLLKAQAAEMKSALDNILKRMGEFDKTFNS